jgi:hypothetical protein
MLNTDLQGLWEMCINNKLCHLILLLGICICLYLLLSKYTNQRNDFNNIIILQNMINDNKNKLNQLNNTTCNKDIPRMDEALIRNTINLPNRNPALLTSSMVYPEPSKPSDEEKRRTRMDVLNMFYNSFDDDLTTIKARPQNLYVIP